LVQNDTYTSNNYRYHESILTVTDGLGKTPLHILCENSCDLNMMKVILGSTRDHTGNPRAPTALFLLLAKDSKGCTPLHYLSYSRQCPFSSLKHVMDYCKPTSHFNEDRTSVLVDPTLCTDDDGETPLHWALDGYMSSRRIKELTKYSLDAIMIRNHKEKTPFDQFVTNFVDTDWTIHDVCGREVWENIKSYLRVIRDNYRDIHHTTHGKRQGSFDSDFWMPLHFIAGSPYDFPPSFTDLALNYCKADLQKFDSNGMLPLHLACGRKSLFSAHHHHQQQQQQPQQNKSFNDTVSMKILKKFPRGSLKAVKKTKRLALHLAVETKMPMSLIAALIKTNPKSLNTPDPVTKLWPYVLAIVDNDKSLSVSYALLRADPSVLQLAKSVQQRSNNLTGPILADDREYDNDHSLRRTVRRLTIRDNV
ncbi:MAG: ankyrin repeat protein, partial [Bacillariaceae sp.]